MVTKKLTPQKGGKQSLNGRKPTRLKASPRRSTKSPSRKKDRRFRVSPWLVAGCLLLLAGAILYPYIRAGRFASSGARIPLGAQEFCLDLSHWNDNIVWDSLKVVVNKDGCTSKDILHAKRIYPITTVILKATQGERRLDKRYREYWKEAGKRDFTRGAYHFFETSADPVRQAKHYISTVHLSHDDLPPVLDVETMHAGCTKEELNEKVLVWLKEVEKHYGRKPIVYASDSFACDILSSEITSNYPMWIARYNWKKPRFQGWTMWQFTEEAIVYGANGGYVDLSVFNQ